MLGIFSCTSIKTSIFGTNTFSFPALKLFNKKKHLMAFIEILLFLVSTTTILTHSNFHMPILNLFQVQNIIRLSI